MLLILPTAFVNQLELLIVKAEELADELESRISALEVLPDPAEPFVPSVEADALISEMASVLGEIQMLQSSTDYYADLKKVSALPAVDYVDGQPLPDPADYPLGYQLLVDTSVESLVLNITAADIGALNTDGKNLVIVDKHGTFGVNPLTVIFGVLDDSEEVMGSLNVLNSDSELLGRIDLNLKDRASYHFVLRDSALMGGYFENMSNPFVYAVGALPDNIEFPYGNSVIRRVTPGNPELEIEAFDGSRTYYGSFDSNGEKLYHGIPLTDDDIANGHLIITPAPAVPEEVKPNATKVGSELITLSQRRVGRSPTSLVGRDFIGTILNVNPDYGTKNVITFAADILDDPGGDFDVLLAVASFDSSGDVIDYEHERSYSLKYFIHAGTGGMSTRSIHKVFYMAGREATTYPVLGGHSYAVKGLALLLAGPAGDQNIQIRMFSLRLRRDTGSNQNLTMLNAHLDDDLNDIHNPNDIDLPDTIPNIDDVLVFAATQGLSINGFLEDLEVTAFYNDGTNNVLKSWIYDNNGTTDGAPTLKGVGTEYVSDTLPYVMTDLQWSGFYDLDVSRYGAYDQIRGIAYAVVPTIGVMWAERVATIPHAQFTSAVKFNDGNNTIVPGTDIFVAATLKLREGRDGLGVAGFDDDKLYYFYPHGYYVATMPANTTVRDVHCFNKNGVIHILALVKDTGMSEPQIFIYLIPDTQNYDVIGNHPAPWVAPMSLVGVQDLAHDFSFFQNGHTFGDVTPSFSGNAVFDEAAVESTEGYAVTLLEFEAPNSGSGLNYSVAELNTAALVDSYNWLLKLPKKD